jgi:serine/threonine protein kinase
MATTARYIKQQKLGEGTYSRIFRGLDTNTNETVTLKLVRLDLEEDGIPPSALRETTALKNATHPNIISLKSVVWDGPNLQLVLEFMDSDIKRWLNYGARKYDADLLRSYTFQVLCGCAALPLHGIVHHNLQPSHVLINRNGCSRYATSGQRSCPSSRAPSPNRS